MTRASNWSLRGLSHLFISSLLLVPLMTGCKSVAASSTSTKSNQQVYNEMLASILRGIYVSGHQQADLGVKVGYYRIREFRIWGQPDKKAVALCLKKAYGANVNPNLSVLPTAGDEFVFTNFSVWEYSSAGRKIRGTDQHQHTLDLAITFGDCFTVTKCTLDGLPMRTTTQGYLSSQLNTCGVTFEQPFTIPGQ